MPYVWCPEECEYIARLLGLVGLLEDASEFRNEMNFNTVLDRLLKFFTFIQKFRSPGTRPRIQTTNADIAS